MNLIFDLSAQDKDFTLKYVDEKGVEVTSDTVSMNYKKNAVKAYRDHQKSWKFATFQSRYPRVKYLSYIYRWERHILMGKSLKPYTSTIL